MEEECEVFIDPEEDEIFFGKLTGKEVSITAKIKDPEPESQDTKGNLNVNTKTFNDDKFIECILQQDVFNENSDGDANDQSIDALCRGILEDMLDNITFSDCSGNDDDLLPKLTSPQVKKDPVKDPEVVRINVTPVKSIIDKSILSTPKSVVRADKDGGFLKVLSEIALVKAEADFEKSNGKEDEDKENKSVNVPEIKVIEATPDKITKSPSPKKNNQEVRKFRFIYNTPEKKGSDHNELSNPLKKIEEIPDVVIPKEEKLIRENAKPKEHKKLDDVVEFLKKNLEQFENEQKNLKNGPTDILIKEKSVESKINDETESTLVKSEKIENVIEEVNISSDSDYIEILDDTPIKEQPCDDKEPSNVRMSEEARKIVQILNNEAVDDSFNLTIQEIDVDKTQIPFGSPETTDIFNDSLPKPAPVLSNKQAELLKEILSNSPAKSSSPIIFKTPNAKILNTEKKTEDKKLKSTPVVPKKTPVSKVSSANKASSIKRDGINRPNTVEKEKKATPAIVRKTPLSAVSGRLNPIERNNGSVKKCVKKLDVDGKGAKVEVNKGVESAEKETKPQGSSRIPKFNLGTKIPVSGKKAVFQPVIKSNTPARTHLPRTPKAAFAKIESPVNAYIHNRPTPLIKNIKPEVKRDSAKKVWMKQTTGSAKKCGNDEQARKNEADRCKSALPFVEYRSATPLKLEKPIESRLPRLAPTMKKLLTTNSPTVLRHEGRIHLSAPRKVQISTVDNSVMVDPNEVSVVVSHVAQKSNTISK